MSMLAALFRLLGGWQQEVPRPAAAPAPAPAPAVVVRAISEALIAAVMGFESFRAAPYLCPAGVWTIGYGSTRWPDGRAVKRTDAPISREEARRMLVADLEAAAAVVDRAVSVPLTQGQRDALASFVHNVGPGRKGDKDGLLALKESGQPSTLLRRLNAGDYAGAATQFPLWANGRDGTGKLVQLGGLVKRRAWERARFEG